MTPVAAPAKVTFGRVTPVLRVRDVQASVAYYVDKLGFAIHFQMPGFASVSRGQCGLFLCEGDQGHAGSWVWIDGVDVDAVYAEYQGSGAVIRHPPTNYLWALEMQVVDPDGNVLRIGSDPRPDEPIGEWLDMEGVRWRPHAEGGWRKAE